MTGSPADAVPATAPTILEGLAWIAQDRAGRLSNGRISRSSLRREDSAQVAQQHARHIVQCFVDPANLPRLAMNGNEPVGQTFSRFLPTKAHIKSGDYGEILCSLALAARDRPLCFPLFRWRLKLNPNSPVQGADLIGYKLSGAAASVDDVLVLCEVKTRAKRRKKTIARDALRLVQKDYATRLPEQLLYQDRLLREQGLTEHAENLARFRNPHRSGASFNKHIVAGLVHDPAIWSDEYLDYLPESVTTEADVTIELAVLSVEQLSAWFDDMREAAIVAANEGAQIG